MSPAVSVLMPVFNAELYLAEAVESVLAQDMPDFELIAFDDGSSDGSLEILRGFAVRDARVIVHARENRGLVATLNELLGLARAPLLARMDADDICSVDRFSLQRAFLDSNPDIALVGASILQIDARGLPIGSLVLPLTHAEIDRQHVQGHCSIWHPTVMMRAAAARAAGGYRADYKDAEDLDLWLRLAEIAALANLPVDLLRYRLHDQSVSHRSGEQQFLAMQRSVAAAWERRGITDGALATSGHWRPSTDAASRYTYALQYAWTAWANGYRETWRHYAWQALRMRPVDPLSWRLAIGGFLRRPAPRGRAA